MRVEVEFGALVRLQGIRNGSAVELPAGTSIAVFLDRCQMRREHQKALLSFVNGVKKSHSHIFQDGESLYLQLAVGGG